MAFHIFFLLQDGVIKICWQLRLPFYLFLYMTCKVVGAIWLRIVYDLSELLSGLFVGLCLQIQRCILTRDRFLAFRVICNFCNASRSTMSNQNTKPLLQIDDFRSDTFLIFFHKCICLFFLLYYDKLGVCKYPCLTKISTVTDLKIYIFHLPYRNI